MTAALLLAAALPTLAAAKPTPATPHPLDPLSRAEITETVSIIRATKIFPLEAMFPVVALQEPAKREVLDFVAGRPASRMAFAVVFDRARNETSEALVDLKTKRLASWRIIPEAQPNFLIEERSGVPAIVRADPRWQDALRKRGITDFDEVHIDGWAAGTLGVTSTEGPRLARALSFYKGHSSNSYARPIEGVIALVDLNTQKVLQVTDTSLLPLSQDDGAFDAESQRLLRFPPKPLRVWQPKGSGAEVRGNEVRWQKWRFRFALHPREGLVLHLIAYDDNDRTRPILYRAGLSEMVVLYNDPDLDWVWRNPFGEGEYGLGRLLSPLEPGVDVPENAVFFDAAFADDFGKAYKLPRAAALYERDGGLLWKHYQFDRLRNESRRGRELVITSIATVGHYDYSYSWVFRQDGSLECEVGLTGIMLAKGLPPEALAHDDLALRRVSTLVAAPPHQHFFNFRLDFDVDGATNTVYEQNARMLPLDKENPHGNAIALEETPLRTEKLARRDMSPASSRRWVVRNPESLNAMGQPVGYALIPGENTVPLVNPASLVRQRADFINHPLWVTAYDAEQSYAAGDYPNQSRGWEGLDRWTDDDDTLEDRDIVLWYTLGVTHLPRPEEWPIMPIAKAGFKLAPVSFFSRNPALDLPRPLPAKRRK